MIDRGFMITSIDEEGNLNDYGYEGFAKTRYSDETIEQSTAVFGWGSDDVDKLKETYSKYSNKIYKTGSPRADLWKPFFSDYWNVPLTIPKKPFLLISCNTGYANNIKSFGELIKFEKPSILVPFKFSSENHQHFNAKFLQDNFCSIVLFYLL